MPNEIDPRLLSRLAANRTTRRRFLGGGAAAAAALTLGPSFLAACGGGDQPSGAPATTTEDTGAASGTLRISNWPLYMADGFVAAFQTASGITVDYKEDFNDNEQWFAKVKEPLSRKQDIGADLVVPTQFMAARLHQPRLAQRHQRLRRAQQEEPAARSAGRQASTRTASSPRRTCRAWSGWPTTGRPPAATSPRSTTCGIRRSRAGSACSPTSRTALGMIMLSQGNSAEDPTTETVQKAVDLVREQKDKGQIRRFTGNDYADDLAAGNIAVAQAYSGDVVQLQADNPDLQFVVPESGGDDLRRHHGDPVHHAEPEGRRGVDQLRLRPGQLRQAGRLHPVRAGAVRHDRRADKIDPGAGGQPADQPAEGDPGQVEVWAPLTDEQTQEFNTALRRDHRRIADGRRSQQQPAAEQDRSVPDDPAGVGVPRDLVPLAVLHEILRKVGLARLGRGVLSPTRAAADDQEVVRRLRTWFEPEGFRGILGGIAVAILAVSGPLPSAELVRRVMPLVGQGWVVEGRPLTDADVELMLHGVSAELRALDLLGGDWRTWEAGPSARTLLTRVTALADRWTREPTW